jgi:hypothetical protein
MKYVLTLALALICAGPASAQHSHGPGAQKGPNGGVMEDVAGVHAELVTTGTTITINIFDEDNKALPTKGYTGAALVVAGADRETVTLSPSGDSALRGDAKKAVAKGATVTLTLKTAAGKSGQVRFKP